jgi:hypothetical protein
MTHLLVIVLLIVFTPIALATIARLAVSVLLVAGYLIWLPFYCAWKLACILCRIPGILYRTPGALYRGGCSFVVSEGLREFLGAAAIVLAITLLLTPFFPTPFFPH